MDTANINVIPRVPPKKLPAAISRPVNVASNTVVLMVFTFLYTSRYFADHFMTYDIYYKGFQQYSQDIRATWQRANTIDKRKNRRCRCGFGNNFKILRFPLLPVCGASAQNRLLFGRFLTANNPHFHPTIFGPVFITGIRLDRSKFALSDRTEISRF